MRSNLRWSVFAAAWVLLLGTPVESSTWIVAPDGSGDATTIQDGMALATAGDSVLVQPGTYTGRVDLVSGVALIGEAGAGVTTLDAAGGQYCAQGYGLAESLIQGLTLTGVSHSGYSFTGIAAVEVRGDVEIRDCVVSDNFAIYGGIYGSGNVEIYDTLFSDNWGGTDAVGVAGISLEGGLLRVERCEFVAQYEGIVSLRPGDLIFRDNVVRDNASAKLVLSSTITSTPVHVVLEENLFVDNGLADITAFGSEALLTAEIRGNTYARSPFQTQIAGPGWVIENNLVTGSDRGIDLRHSTAGYVVRCNDVWGNAQNWYGLPDPTGTDGNISEEPKYCGSFSNNFTLAENSPCLPANNACGVQMGAFGQGCGPLSVESESWGGIKALYRD